MLRQGSRAVRVAAAALLALGVKMSEAVEPENVAVVVNEESWASVTLADAYVRLRGIPATNVILLSGLPDFETIGVDDFRARILKPVFSAIDARGLRERIDCIAYSADIPYAILFSSDIGANKAGPHVGNVAALTGLTYLYEAVLANAPQVYTALDVNRYARRALAGTPEDRISESDALLLRQAAQLLQEQKPREAARLLSPFCERRPNHAFALYNLACCQALDGESRMALDSLERAAEAGWWNVGHAEADRDLASVRAHPAFARIKERMGRNRAALSVQKTVPFKARNAWDAGGDPSALGTGPRYMLSTMLGITSGRGTSVREAVAAMERAAAADGTRPAGTVYYMSNGDVRSTTRRWGFEAAVRLLKEAGVSAVIEEGALPKGKTDVAGAMVGVSDFDFAASGSRILPGAICEHLTSCGGIMTWGGGQTELTAFIRHGAAGASGTVTEPYAIQAKFPDPFIQVHYARGATLAEAFYQSVSGPYQLLIVGDPLCRPWGAKRTVSAEHAAGAALKGKVPDVGAPAAMEAGLRPESLRRGFRVSGDGVSRAMSGGLGSRSWRDVVGVVTGGDVALEGYVEARTNELYQFQAIGGAPVQVSVGGRELKATGNGNWRMFPVALEAGWHAVSVRLAATGGVGKAAAGFPNDLRFGARGLSPLSPQLKYQPRQGEVVHNTGLGTSATVEELAEDPWSARFRFGIEGLDPAVEGTMTLAWETPEGGGWTVEPAHAATGVTKGVCKPVVFQVRYKGEPFATNGFYRLPACHVQVQGEGGVESADPVSLPLERILKGKVRPGIRAPRLAEAPVIDGKLEEKAWAGRAAITRFLRPQLDRPAEQPTEAWLAWDERGLYVAARCREPRLDALRLKAKARDDSVFMDDSVEFFVSEPGGDAKTYYQVVVNAAGVIYDGKGLDRSWNGDITAAAGREAGAWTLEMAIPWSTIGKSVPKADSTIRILLARNRKVGQEELSLWPFASGGNHQPPLFGEAVLGE